MISRKRMRRTRLQRLGALHWRGITAKQLFKFLSALILPTIFGISTVVLTLHQAKVARDQRTEDMQLAREQRVEDQQLARQQRLEDRNESRLQREQDWNIAKLDQETQMKAIHEQYEDELLTTYIKETSDLIEKSNGSLTRDALLATLARVKTLNILRQLDDERQEHVIRFLCEALQLTPTNRAPALDITGAKLTNIHFDEQEAFFCPKQITLAGALFDTCTFPHLALNHTDLSFARLNHVNFSRTRFSKVKMASTQLTDVDLSSAFLEDVDLANTRCTDINFRNTTLSNVNFSSTSLINASFSFAYLSNVDFTSTIAMSNVSFASALLLSDVRFTATRYVFAVNFASIPLDNVDFSFVQFFEANFTSTRLTAVNFTSAHSSRDHAVSFSSTVLIWSFIVANVEISFHSARVLETTFERCNCKSVDFTSAVLLHVIFSHASLLDASFRHATFEHVDFTLANLRNADFTNTTITDDQLRSALSIRNARLPNGTLGQARNLIKHGDANCNISLTDHWHVHSGTVTLMNSANDRSDCQFTVKSTAVMSQRINLVDAWNSSIWTKSQLELQISVSDGVSIGVQARSADGILVDEIVASMLNLTLNESIVCV